MKTRIKQLEQAAQLLEPNQATRTELTEQVVRYSEQYLDQLPIKPAYQTHQFSEADLATFSIGEESIDMETALGIFQRNVEKAGITMSPGMMAFVPGNQVYPAALADYLAAVVNKYVGVYAAAPGAVRLERSLLRWMADFIGYPATSAGDLTSGGSIANLVGIVTARDAHQLKARDFHRVVAYYSAHSHHSIGKALRLAGLRECENRPIPVDKNFRMRPEALEQAIIADKKAGLLPWLVVASAGTTDTGAVDPLYPLADIATHHGLWLHVDGAYGAPFALCALGQQVLQGLGRSDSLVLDPHKALFIPFGTGAVLIKDAQYLLQSHYYSASYMQDVKTLANSGNISPSELSPELTRPFRALRLWLPLKLAGLAPFRAALEEKMLLARYFHQQISQLEGFVVGPTPDLSIVTFRYVPQHGDANAFNQALINAVQKDGRLFITSTMLDGQFTLRLAILNLGTHLETIDLVIEILQEKVGEVIRE